MPVIMAWHTRGIKCSQSNISLKSIRYSNLLKDVTNDYKEKTKRKNTDKKNTI